MAAEHRYRGKQLLVGFFLGTICLQGLFHQTRAYPYTLGNSNGEEISSRIEEAERNFQEAEDFVEWTSSENNVKRRPTIQEDIPGKNEDKDILVEEILPEIFDLDSLDILKNAPELLRNLGDQPSTDSNIKGVIYGMLDDGDLEEWHNSFQYVSYREARQAVDPPPDENTSPSTNTTEAPATNAPPSNETTPTPSPDTTTIDPLLFKPKADYYSEYVPPPNSPAVTYQTTTTAAPDVYPANPAPEYGTSNKEYTSGSTNSGYGVTSAGNKYEPSKPGYGSSSGTNYEYVLCKIAGKDETVKCPLKGKCAPVLPYDKDCTGKLLEKCPLAPTCVSETASGLCDKNSDCKGSPYKFCVLKETAACAQGSICTTVTSFCVDLSKKDNYESISTIIKEATSTYDKEKDYTPPGTSYTKDYPKEPSKSYEKEDYKPPSTSYTKDYPKEPSKSYEKEDYKPPSNSYTKDYPKEPSKPYEKEEKYPSPTKSYPKKKKKTKKVMKDKKYPKPSTKGYTEEKYPESSQYPAPDPYPTPSSQYPEKENPYPSPAPSKYPDSAASYPDKQPDYDDTYPGKDYESNKPDSYPDKEYESKPNSYPEKEYETKPDKYPAKPYDSKPNTYGSSNNVYSGNTKEAALKRIKRLYKICKIGGIETLCLIKEDCVKVVAYNSDCLVNPKVACKTYKPACIIRGGTTCKNFQCPNYGKCLDVENLDCKDYCTLGEGYKTVKLGCPPRPFCLPKEPPARKSSCEKHSHEPGYVYSDEKEYNDYKPTPAPPPPSYYDDYKPMPSPTYDKPEPKPKAPYKPKKMSKPKKAKKPKRPAVYKPTEPPAYSGDPDPMPTETSKEYL